MDGPLLARTLSGAIVDRLRQDILGGAYAPGAQLKQDMLAAAFGVSRIPVREALLQLEAEGLVRIQPHRGAVVTPIAVEEIADVFDLRALLEVRLLRSSVPRLTADHVAEIRRIQRAFAAAISAGDAARWGRLNADFHLALYAAANQPRTLAIVAGLLQVSERHTRLQLSGAPAWRRAEAEHAELVALCAARDTEAAVALMVRHIESVRVDLLRLAEGASPRERA
jgi:DNA-binding GntR family transcriptional regulator